MLGLIVFVLIALVPAAVGAFLDRGSRERRRLKAAYAWVLLEMAEFEKAGGRVQEIDHSTDDVRRKMRLMFVQQWAGSGVLSLLLAWVGAPPWVAASMIGLWVVWIGAVAWIISDTFGVVDGRMPGSRVKAAAGLLALAGKASLVSGGVVSAHVGVARANDGEWGVGLFLMVLALMLLAWCHLPVAMIDRRLQRRREVDFARTTRTDAVLFLRSFADDDLRFYSPFGSLGPRFRFVPGRQRFEELVLATLVGRRELVGVGAPGEKMPLLGASRTYWDQDNWKDAIRSTASRTEALLVLAGKTSSLSWELTQLADLGLLGKTLIVFPPDDPEGTAQRYAHVDAALGFDEAHRLPDALAVALSAIAFTPTGSPIHYLTGGRDWSSYVATMVHFQLVVDGQVEFEPEGAVAAATGLVDDTFEQAAQLLAGGERALAESILAKEDRDESDLKVLIGRAWQRVALHEDLEGARELLVATTTADGAAGAGMVDRALHAVDAVERGAGHRAILRARLPERFQDKAERVRRGTAKLDRLSSASFLRLIGRIGAAEEAEDYDAAHALSRKLVEFAKDAGISTFVAMARIQLGEVEVARGNVVAAQAQFRDAAALRDAPRVTLSPLLPRIDPVEVVDEALSALVKAYDAADDVARRNGALQELLTFRTAYGTLEETADTADELGLSHARAGEYEAAIPLLYRAQADYLRVGRLLQAARVMRWLAQAEKDRGELQAAATWADQGLDLAGTADDVVLRAALSELAGDVHERLGKGGNQEHRAQALTHFESAVCARRELVAGGNSVREHLEKLSVALVNLGLAQGDVAAATAFMEEALSIRRGLVEGAPDDFWLNRRVAFAHLYLADNARRLGSRTGSGSWREAIAGFVSLTDARHPATSVPNLATVIREFTGSDDARPVLADLEAVSELVPSIARAMQRAVEHADPADAYRITRAAIDLAQELRRLPDRRGAILLCDDAITARLELSRRHPEVVLYRRGVAYALLTADFRCLPDDVNAALDDLQEAVEIFEELLGTSSEEQRPGALSDLLGGVRHAARTLLGVEAVTALKLADRAAVLARDQIVAEPSVGHWKSHLVEALVLGGRAAGTLGEAGAIDRYRAVVSLDLDEGYPARPRWNALMRWAFALRRQGEAVEALRRFEDALALAESQLAAGDPIWEWEVVNTLSWAAGTQNALDPEAALAKWLTCIAIQERRVHANPSVASEVELLAEALNHAGALVGESGAAESRELLERSEELYGTLAAQDPMDPVKLRAVVEVRHDRALVLSRWQPAHSDTAAAWARVASGLETLATMRELTAEESEIHARATDYETFGKGAETGGTETKGTHRDDE